MRPAGRASGERHRRVGGKSRDFGSDTGRYGNLDWGADPAGEADFGEIGSSRYLSPAYPDRLVYGNIRLTLGPERTVTSRYDVYDFDIQAFQGSWTSRGGLALNARTFGRNGLTVLGSGLAGSGTPYRINFIGVGRIGPRP